MFQKMKVIVPLAVIISSIATFAIYQYIKNVRESANKPKIAITQIVVANSDLEMGWKLRESDLKVSQWPENIIPPNSFSDLAQLTDRVIKINIYKGEPILDSKLAPLGSEGGFSSIIPQGYRALTVNVDSYTGVSGFILPNARVDVLVTVPSTSRREYSKTKIILEDIKVLAVDQTYERKGDDPVIVQNVTLLVKPEDAEKLALACSEGKLQLSLRNTTDRTVQPTAGVRLQELISSSIRRRATGTTSSRTTQTSSEISEEKTIEILRSGERSEVKVKVEKKGNENK